MFGFCFSIQLHNTKFKKTTCVTFNCDDDPIPTCMFDIKAHIFSHMLASVGPPYST